MARIIAPNKQYTGISATVHFVNGIGETSDPALIEWFKEKGYEVEGDEPEKVDEPETEKETEAESEEPKGDEPEKPRRGSRKTE